jgi:3-hydroxyisobutyrate dehydrogenase
MAEKNLDDIAAVALLGLGEAGTAIARGLAEHWRGGDASRRILSVDTAKSDNVRGPAISERAHEIGIEIEDRYTSALAAAEVVISVVTGVEAKNAAEAAKSILRPGALYLDVNTLTGKQTADIAANVDAEGIDYVDVAAMGGFSTYGHKAPFVLSGPAAERAAAWMRPLGFDVSVMSERAGDASAVKIIRSIMVKGLEALGVECLVAAHRAGLTDEVLACFADIDDRTFAGMVTSLTASHTNHAKRRMEEVDKVMENLAELGMEPIMSTATRRSHARTVDADIAFADGVNPSFEDAVSLLSQKVVKGLPT